MSTKKKIILAIAITFPLFLVIGYHIIVNYSESTNTIDTYDPSSTTITEVIKETVYSTPIFQKEQRTEHIPPNQLNISQNTTQPRLATTNLEPYHKEDRLKPPVLDRIPEPQPRKFHTVNKQNQIKPVPQDPDPIWSNLNQYQATIQPEFNQTSFKNKKHKKKYQKDDHFPTMFSLFKDKAPDIEIVLGYTKERKR